RHHSSARAHGRSDPHVPTPLPGPVVSDVPGRKTVETFGGRRTFVRRSDPPNTGLKAQLRGEAPVPASRRLALLVILVPAFARSASCPDQTAECVPDDARKTPGGHTFTGEHL